MSEQPGPDGVEAMALQLVLSKLSDLEHKLSGVEQAVQQTVPLLGKIVAQLEALNKKPDVPVATYAQLYTELQEEEVPEPPVPVAQVLSPVPSATLQWKHYWAVGCLSAGLWTVYESGGFRWLGVSFFVWMLGHGLLLLLAKRNDRPGRLRQWFTKEAPPDGTA
jgi:hypothetical protein